MLLDTSACKLQKPVLVTVNVSLKVYVPAITAHVRLLAELIYWTDLKMFAPIGHLHSKI